MPIGGRDTPNGMHARRGGIVDQWHHCRRAGLPCRCTRLRVGVRAGGDDDARALVAARREGSAEAHRVWNRRGHGLKIGDRRGG
jgi:hypothetical protein